MLRAAFIGAGRRAQSAHYPCVTRLEDVRLEAVAELDPTRMQQVATQYHIPRQYTDYRAMLEEVDPDVVYVIMGETFVTRPAVDCMNAGKHVFIEKPAGANSDESQQLLETAEANQVYCMVGYQRRYGAVTQEAMRRVQARGPATMAIGRFHKNLFARGPGATSTLWNDVCHVIDLVRYMMGREVIEVTAYQDSHQADWRNCYNGLIRFAGHGVGIISGNRSSGGRVLRAELHGIGVGCYMRPPDEIEIYEDNQPPQTLTGAEIAGVDPQDRDSYEGVLTMHRHFIDCIQKGQVPISDIRDVIHTSRLVDQLEGIA